MKARKVRYNTTRSQYLHEIANRKYRELDIVVKRCCKRDKKKWVDDKGREAQEGIVRNDSKTVYKIVRDLTGSPAAASVPVKDKNGKILMIEEEWNARWVEHFSSVLNQPHPSSTLTLKLSLLCKNGDNYWSHYKG